MMLYKIRFFLVGSLILLSTVCVKSADIPYLASSSSTQLTSVDYDKFPLPGKTAFIASIPGRPSERKNRVIFIPSQHAFPLSKMNPDILRDIKNCDILVTESYSESSMGLKSMDPAKRVESILKEFPSYKKESLLSQGLFSVSQEFLFDGKPWTNHLDPAAKDFLEKSTKDFRGDIPLSHMHPYLIYSLVKSAQNLTVGKRIGMDHKLRSFFIHEGRPIKYLETRAEAILDDTQELGWSEENNSTKEQLLIYIIKRINQQIMLYMNANPELEIVPNKVKERAEDFVERFNRNIVIIDPDVSRRSHLWVPRIVDFIKENPNNSIALVLGAGHFRGREGLLSLLSKEHQFSFSRMSTTNASNANPPNHSETMSEIVAKRDKLMNELNQKLSQKNPMHTQIESPVEKVKEKRVTEALETKESQAHENDLIFVEEKLHKIQVSLMEIYKANPQHIETITKAIQDIEGAKTAKEVMSIAMSAHKEEMSYIRSIRENISIAKEIGINLTNIMLSLTAHSHHLEVQKDIEFTNYLISSIGQKANEMEAQLAQLRAVRDRKGAELYAQEQNANTPPQ